MSKINGEIMFDWKKFVLLGYLLLSEESEEYIRSGISRQFNHKSYLQSRQGDVHHNVSIELRNSNDLTQKEIYKIFNRLR